MNHVLRYLAFMMTLLAQADSAAPPVIHATAIVSTLDGVTTVLTAFLFVCLIFPSIVKHRQQYFAALAMVIGILLLHTVELIVAKNGTVLSVLSVFIGILQIGALLVLVLSVGGLSARELAGDMARAYEVIRRGETEKEVIIPIGEQGRKREQNDSASKVYNIDTGTRSTDSSIPLDE